MHLTGKTPQRSTQWNLHTFAIDETADHNNCNPVVLALGGVRGKICGINSIGNNRHDLWVEGSTEHRVLLAGIGDAHNVVSVAHRYSQKLVGQHRADVSKTEE